MSLTLDVPTTMAAAPVEADVAESVQRGAGVAPFCATLLSRHRVSVAEAASLLAWLFTGVSFVVTKRSFEDASPLVRSRGPQALDPLFLLSLPPLRHAQLFQALRFTVGTLALVVLYRRRSLALRTHTLGSCVVGLLLSCGYLLQTLALSRTSPTRNAFLTALCVPLTPLLLPFFTRVAPTVPIMLAAGMAAVGTWLLTGGGGGAGWGIGDHLMIGCAVFFALHFIALNHFCTRAPDAPEAIAVGQMLVATIISWAFVPLDLLDGLFVHVTPALVGGVLATGLFATGGAFALLSWAQRHMSASRTAVICATEPLFAALAAYLMLGEGMGAAPLGGGAIILGSIFVSSVEDTAAARRAMQSWCSRGAGDAATI